MLLQVPFSKKVTVACAWSPCGGKRCRCLDIVWLSRYSSEPPGKQGPGIETHFLRTALHCSGDPCPSLEGRVRRQGRCLRGLTMVTPSPSGRGEGATSQDVTGGNEAFKTGLEIWDYLEILSQMRNTPRKQGRAWHETPPPGPEPKYQRTSEMCFDKAA